MDFQSEFLAEADEHLDNLESLCLKAEKASSKALIDEAFCLVHTIKGTAMSVGFTAFGAVAHRMENTLAAWRQAGDQALNIEQILRFHDVLRAYVSGLRHDPAFVLDTRELGLSDDGHPPAGDAGRGDAAPHAGPPLAARVDHLPKAMMPAAAAPASPTVPAPASPAPMAGRSIDDGGPVSPGDRHRDDNLYYRAFLQGMQTPAREEDTWLFSSLSRLAVPLGATAGFAAGLRDAFSGHADLRAICRVSLVRRIGFANQLEVLSSDGDSAVNLMQVGYRCFVAPTGSLFKLSANALRVFGDARKIVVGYGAEGRAPQRSIFRVAAMGLRSGIAIGIYADKLMVGLLFMNASNDFLAKLPEPYLPVLSYVSMLAHKHFLGRGQERLYTEVWQEHQPRLSSRAYSAAALAAEVHWVLARFAGAASPAPGVTGAVSQPATAPAVDVAIAGPADLPTLLSHGHAAYLLARLITMAQATRLQVTAAIVGSDVQFHCDLAPAPVPVPSPALAVLHHEAENLAYKLNVLSATQLTLTTDLDPLGADTTLCYSTESIHT